ncbi:hypothetical protein BAY59_22735 [Prauserella coralliicola]|nr:hypothetical protein BAY59_22735 [Prauserella coralliicola]
MRRALLAPLTLVSVLFVVFLMVELSPNNPVQAALGPYADAETRDRFAAEHGLNDPLLVRFGRFLVDLTQFDLGQSMIRSESVGELIAQALPITIELILFAAIISILSSLLLGTAAAMHEGRAADRLISAGAAILQASPEFWVGLMFIQLFSVTLGFLPSGGYAPITDGLDVWLLSILGPAIVLSLPFTAALTRLVRTSMADELAKDYVRTAIGAGVSWPRVLTRNVLRNALMMPITVLGVYIGTLMSGTVLVEVVFNVPGMGNLLITAVKQSDLAVVRAIAIVGAISFVIVNLLVDLAYLFLNPRSAEARTQ